MDKKKILVVDDEPDLVKMLVYRLEAKGYEIFTALNGKEALSAVDIHKPDLILLDYRLPDMLAPAIAQQIKAKEGLGQIPIILITATTQSITEKAQECLAVDYILKPIEPQELYLKVEKYINPP